MPTTWIYARVSEDEAEYICCGTEHSARFGARLSCKVCGSPINTEAQPVRIGGQIREGREYAAFYGLPEPHRAAWEVVSARKVKFGQRTVGSQILEQIRRGDHFVAVRLERVFRKNSDTFTTLETFAERGVTAHFTQQKLDTSSISGKLVLAVLSAVAEYEVDEQSQRRRVGMRNAKDSGRSTGNAPFGKRVEIKIEGNKQVKFLVPDEQEVELLHRMVVWNNAGWSIPKIAAEMRKIGYVSRKGTPYSDRMVKQLRKLAIEKQLAGALR